MADATRAPRSYVVRNTRTSACRHCGQPIAWQRHGKRQRWIPVDVRSIVPAPPHAQSRRPVGRWHTCWTGTGALHARAHYLVAP